jgi:hypothetical protein
VSLILVESLHVNVALGGLNRFPLYGKHVPQNLNQTLALLCRGSFVESDQGPFHLAPGEIATQVPGDPKLGSRKACISVVALVDFIGVIEPTVVFRLAVFGVRRRVRAEITDAEVWTAACFDGSCVDRPARRR